MNKPKEEIIDIKKIKQIRLEHPLLDIGSGTSCYLLDRNTVIKLFEATCNPEEKLFLPNEIYENDTFHFVDTIQKTEIGNIAGYTMPYIKGESLEENNFGALPISTLLKYIKLFLKDTKTVSEQGIYTFDNYITNIILSNNGFKCIDTTEFKLEDKDPTILYKKNIEIFFTNFWEFLLPEETKKVIKITNLKEQNLYEDPYHFFTELHQRTQNTTNKKIETINDIKKLTKKR